MRLGSEIFPSRSHRMSVLLLTPICRATSDVEYSALIYVTTNDIYLKSFELSSGPIWSNTVVRQSATNLHG